jgi:hypothetical protein
MDAAVSIGNVDHPRSRRRREWPYAWMFSGPAAVVLLPMMAFPVAYTLYLSVTNWTPTLGGSAKFVGLQNYLKLIAQDERFHHALWRTLWFTAAGVVRPDSPRSRTSAMTGLRACHPSRTQPGFALTPPRRLSWARFVLPPSPGLRRPDDSWCGAPAQKQIRITHNVSPFRGVRRL